jgi:hypothetical protein
LQGGKANFGKQLGRLQTLSQLQLRLLGRLIKSPLARRLITTELRREVASLQIQMRLGLNRYQG